MKEQLRTEAEKEIFNELSFTGLDKPFVNSEENTDDALVFLKIILKKNNVRQHLNIRDCGYSQLERDIVDGIKKFGHFESHNFHAQQSKTDADKIIILENKLRVQKGIVSRLKQKYNHQENEIEPLFSLTNSNSETAIKESQQSKPNTEAIDRLKSIIEACPRGSFFRLELNKVLKDLQIK